MRCGRCSQPSTGLFQPLIEETQGLAFDAREIEVGGVMTGYDEKCVRFVQEAAQFAASASGNDGVAGGENHKNFSRVNAGRHRVWVPDDFFFQEFLELLAIDMMLA